MIAKTVLALCLVAAAAAEDLDAVMMDIFGNVTTPEPDPNETTTVAPVEKYDACTKNDGTKGQCVPYYLCKAEIYSDFIDIHFPEENICASYIDTCCSDSDRTTLPGQPETKREGCGWRNPQGVGGVVLSGSSYSGKAQFGEFPWVCAILKVHLVNSTGNLTVQDIMMQPVQKPTYLGSGTLIHPGVVMTGAHLVQAPGKYRVRCGEWDSVNEREPYPHQEIEVEEVMIHEDYRKKTLRNDIALLFLSEAMELTPHVGLACLPPPHYHVETGGCFSTGWRKDQFGAEGRFQNLLKKVELSTINHTTCENQLRTTRLGPQFRLHSSFSCSTGHNCEADGGAPLSCPIESAEGRYMATGMVAWSVGCQDVPSVYADVSSLRSWVDDQFQKYEFDTSSYTYGAESDGVF